MKIASLKPNPNNPRIIKDEKFARLKKSLEEFPQMMALRPIVIDESGMILGGNMRLAALKANGLKEIPDDWVKRADELTEDQKQEFIIKDNNAFGEYDWDALANGWDDLPLADWGVDLPQDWLETSEPKDAEPQIDKAAELQQKWQVATGEIIQIGRHRLMCGDSTEKRAVAALCAGEQAQAIVTSPPYGVGMEYEEKEPDFNKTCQLVTAALSEYIPRVVKNGFAFINFGERWVFPEPMGAVYNRVFKAARWRWYAARYWKRSTVALTIWNTTQPRPMSDMECCWTWQNGTGAYPVNDLAVSKESLWLSEGDDDKQPHQAQMHVSIATRAISIHSKPEDLILEPFGGTGTTMVAAENLNRTCYAMEISPEYCAVILERMTTAFPGIEIKRESQAVAA